MNGSILSRRLKAELVQNLFIGLAHNYLTMAPATISGDLPTGLRLKLHAIGMGNEPMQQTETLHTHCWPGKHCSSPQRHIKQHPTPAKGPERRAHFLQEPS